MINWRKPLIYLFSFLQGSKRMKYYNRILKYADMPDEELQDLQQERLSRLLLHAYEHVPYYKEILKKTGVVKGDEVNLDNFEKIPFLTKDILKKDFEDLKSDDIDTRKWYLNHSGGSTGEPTEFVQDEYYEDWNIANKLYYKKIAGQDIGMKEVRLWGSERDFNGDKEKPMIRFRNWVFNRVDLNAFTMTEGKMLEYVEFINKFKPTWIEAYVQPLYELALFVEKKGLEVHSPNGVLTSAGTLYPEVKSKLEEVFKCKVWNRYGSREAGDMAFGEEELRLSVWNHFLEVDDNTGKIYVTTLNNYSMPLIRFDMGDIATMDEEKWGFLGKLEGRESSALKNRNGKIVPGLLFVHFLGVVMNNGVIKRFQIIQKDYESVDIKVVVKDQNSFEKSRDDIENLICKAMDSECKINWLFVKDIPPLKSGKYLYVKSEVK